MTSTFVMTTSCLHFKESAAGENLSPRFRDQLLDQTWNLHVAFRIQGKLIC